MAYGVKAADYLFEHVSSWMREMRLLCFMRLLNFAVESKLD